MTSLALLTIASPVGSAASCLSPYGTTAEPRVIYGQDILHYPEPPYSPTWQLSENPADSALTCEGPPTHGYNNDSDCGSSTTSRFTAKADNDLPTSTFSCATSASFARDCLSDSASTDYYGVQPDSATSHGSTIGAPQYSMASQSETFQSTGFRGHDASAFESTGLACTEEADSSHISHFKQPSDDLGLSRSTGMTDLCADVTTMPQSDQEVVCVHPRPLVRKRSSRSRLIYEGARRIVRGVRATSREASSNLSFIARQSTRQSLGETGSQVHYTARTAASSARCHIRGGIAHARKPLDRLSEDSTETPITANQMVSDAVSSVTAGI